MSEQFYNIITPFGGSYNIIDVNGTIYLGGNKYYCIVTGVFGNNGNELFINSNKECTIYKKYPSIKIGDDMMFALIYFLQIKYKTCEIIFNDKSSDKKIGSLPIYCLAFNQCTWYERKFGARLQDQKMQEIYKNTKLNFYSTKFKNNNRTRFEILMKKLNENTLLKIYDNSSTIKEFFQIIKEKINNKEINFKELIQPWLEEFIKVNMQFNFMFNSDVKWIINCNINIPLMQTLNADRVSGQVTALADKVSNEKEYIIKELSKDPLPKWKNKYIKIQQKDHYEKQYGGMKKLEQHDKEYLEKNPNWDGVWNLPIYAYNPKDRKYIENLQKKNFLMEHY
jgi:hypothetical protein